MSPLESYGGGCLCGQVRFLATGDPINVRICHCRNCQKATGSAFFARALFAIDQVVLTGRAGAYFSSKDLARLYCPACGSTIGARCEPRGTQSLALGCLDDPDALRPTEHIFVTRKVAWLELDDGLPQYADYAPA